MKQSQIMMALVLLFMLIFATACSTNTNDTSSVDGKEAGQSSEDVSLIISAAASLTNAMKDIGANYMEKNPAVELTFNFGGSGTLMQQILKGAPSDLFLSAAADKFKQVVEAGKIKEGTGVDLLSNSLTLVVPEGKEHIGSFEDLAAEDYEKLAIGMPETVPAGQYAQQSLKNMNLWKQAEPQIVFTKDVRQVLQYVETGNVAAGIVYKTDAIISDEAEIVAEAPPETHPPITYPAGIIKDTEHSEAAQDFYAYLQSDAAIKVFKNYGFTVK